VYKQIGDLTSKV